MQIKVWGPLNGQVYLNTTHEVDSSIEDIRWHKNRVKIAQFNTNSQFLQLEKFETFMNGTLKIKYLTKEDNGNYSMDAYNRNGVYGFGDKFVLEVQGKFPKILYAIVSTILVSCVIMLVDFPSPDVGSGEPKRKLVIPHFLPLVLGNRWTHKHEYTE